MAQCSFPPSGPFAVAPPRTLREYRQAIFAGLESLRNDDLELLLTLHFPEIDHVQDAQRNRNNILVARLPLIDIWTRVSAFLAWSKLPPLDGEAPPGDLFNRSSRILIAEVPSSVTTAAAPAAESTWSCSEITLPGFLAQPAPRGETTTIPVANLANGLASGPVSQPVMAQAVMSQPVSQPVLPQPAVRQFSWPAFGGLLLIVALIGVHVCPYVRHKFSQAKPEHLVSLEAPPLSAPALPRLTVIPVAELPLPLHRHGRHHQSAAGASQSLDLTSESECRFTRTRLVHGQLKDKTIRKKLALPYALKAGSPEAMNWLQAACARAQQDLPAGR